MHDDDIDLDTDTDDQPLLTTEEADEVVALVRTALGDVISEEPPIEGDLGPLIENTLEHRLPEHALWLEQAPIGVSMCAHCGAVTIYLLSQDKGPLHSAIEIVEYLREQGSERLGGDLEDMVCIYRRPTVNVGGAFVGAYIFGATYWLSMDDVEDRVIHATRSLVAVLDGITSVIKATREQVEILRALAEED